MRKMVDLSLVEQASVVLLCLLEDVVTEKRTLAGIDHHVEGLWTILGDHFDIPDQEVEAVVTAVAKRGIEMLPAYEVKGEDTSSEPEVKVKESQASSD